MWEGSLWRAGLPRVGARSGPDTAGTVFQKDVIGEVLGLLRSPTRGKPARHSKAARYDKLAYRKGHEVCV